MIRNMRRGNLFLGSRAVALILTWAVPAPAVQAASGSPAPAATPFNTAATQIADPTTSTDVQGMITGQVLSDVTGLPLPGASVRVVGGAGQPTLTDERGRYAIPTTNNNISLVIEKAGHTSAYRTVSVTEGAGTVPADARLTPLSTAVAIDGDGASLTALTVRSASAPDGARVSMTVAGSSAGASVTLTGLSAQGIPALLPLGWSVLAAFDLRSTSPLSNLPTQLTGLGVNGAAQLVTYDVALDGWRQAGTQTISGGALTLQVSGPGVHALVVADPVEPPIAVPAAGGVLEGLDPEAFPLTATGMGTVNPGTVPPSGATAHGQVSIQGTGLPPSGTPVYTEVTESYDLASNVRAGEEKRGQDILVYRQPPPPAQPAAAPAALHASVPLTPSPSFPTEQLQSGKVHLDVYSGREGVRGKVGGSQAITLESGGAQLVLAAGSLPEDAAIVLEAFDGFSSFVASSAGVVPVLELLLDFGGRTLLIPAQLSLDAAGLPTDSTYVVARVVRVEGIPRMTVVAMAAVVGDRLVTQAHPDLPGIRKGGVHVVYRLAAPIGLVAGHVTKGGAGVLAVVTTEALPFVGVGNPQGGGAYVTVSAPGQVTVRASGGGATATATASVVVGGTTALDLSLAFGSQTATVTPPDGAVGVERTALVKVTTDSPIAGASINGSSFHVRKLGADGNPVLDVPIRFVQSADGKTLSVIPMQQLDELQRYRFEGSGVEDVNGAPIEVPVVTFTTKKDQPLARNVDALTFSFPDASGYVHLTLPPASLPPGTQVLVVNSTNGDVLSMTVDNEGGLSGGRMRGTLNDRLIISVTPPDGSIIRFERSQFYDQATGLTAIGSAGGKVEGPGNVEIRVPDGAADHGVKLKISGVGVEGLPVPEGGGAPLLPLSGPTGMPINFGSALKIETPNKDGFVKEVDLAFPVPEGVPADPSKAFYYVFRRVEGPNGKVFHQAVDHAFVEGTGADQRIVTASPPFEGYVANIGRVQLGTQALVEPVYLSYALLMWTYDELMPGKAIPGAATGRVLRAHWTPGATEPRFVPVEGALVTGVDGSGNPLLYTAEPNVAGARTSVDGTFTLWDARAIGGALTVAAIVPNGPLPVTPLVCGESPATPNFGCADLLASVVRDDEDPALRFYRSVVTGNITLPATQPEPAPADLDIEVYEMVEDPAVPGRLKRKMAQGVVQAATPIQIGVDFRADTQGDAELRVGGTVYDLHLDDSEYTGAEKADLATRVLELTELGPTTIEVTLKRPIGGPAVFAKQLYVVRGGSDLSTAPDLSKAPSVKHWLPLDLAKEVPPSNLLEVYFSEPVKNVPGHVRLAPITFDGAPDGVAPELELSGIGRTLDAEGEATEEPLGYISSLSENHLVSMLIVRPRGGLKYGQRYRFILNEGITNGSTAGIHDRDHDAEGINPKGLPTSEITFHTVNDGSTSLGDIRSPGLALLGNRAYLVKNEYQSGRVHIFDVENPDDIKDVTPDPAALVVPRPVDVTASSRGYDFADRLLAVAVASTNVARPSSVYLFDVSDDEHTRWIGASSVVSSGAEGYIQRMQIHGPRLYAATMNKGVQVVGLADAVDAYDEYMLRNPGMTESEKQVLLRADLNTDGRGAGQAAVLSSITLIKRRPKPEEGILGDTNRVLDLAVADLSWKDVVQPIVFTTGDNALSIVVPGLGKTVFGGALETPLYKLENEPRDSVPQTRDEGQAIALGRVRMANGIDRPVALVAGRGRAKQLNGLGPFEAAPVLMVVDLVEALKANLEADYLAQPAVLGGIRLSINPGAKIEDLAVYGSMVIVGTSDGTAEVISFADPTKPASAGLRTDVGGRLAINSDGFVFSTANGILGSQGPEALKYGVNTTQLGRRPLIILTTPRVVDPLILDETQSEALDGDSGPQFIVTRRARIAFKKKDGGVPILARLDDRTQSRQWRALDEADIVEPFVPHRLWIEDADLLPRRLGEILDFEMVAESVEDPTRIEKVYGTIERDRRDRDVLPVGTTFVKNVSVSNGQLVLGRTDFELPGRNFQLKLTRTYSSSGRRWEGLLGANWDWPFEGRIERVGREDGAVYYVVRTITGTTQEFRERGECDYVAPNGYHTELVCDPDPPVEGLPSKLVFTDFQKTKHTFERLPKVLKASMDTWWIRGMEELHGDKLAMHYDEFGRIKRVQELHADEPVHTLRFEYTQAGGDDRVSAAFFDAGHIVVRYQYDEDGNLVEARREGLNEDGSYDPADDRVETYKYSSEEHAAHKMTEYVDPNLSKTNYVWQTDDETDEWHDPKLKEVQEPYAEGETGRTTFDRSQDGVVRVSGPRPSQSTTYDVNAHGNVTRIQEEHGRVTTLEWDVNTQRKNWEKDANDRQVVFTYDVAGNVKTETIYTTDIEGGPVVTSYEYDTATNVLKSKTDAEDNLTKWTINGDGDVTDMTDAVGNLTSYIRNPQTGELVSQVGPKSGVTTVTYEDYTPFGLPQVVKDAGQQITRREYDGRGRLTSERNHRTGLLTTYVYDALDRVKVLTQRNEEAGESSAALVTVTEYYPDGQVKTTTVAPGAPNSLLVENLLDGRNRVKQTTKTTKPNLAGAILTALTWLYAYDQAGNLTWEQDPRGVQLEHVFDRLNRRLETAVVRGVGSTPTERKVIGSSTYDELVKTTDTDIAGNVTHYGYDDLYRVTERRLARRGQTGPAALLDADTYDKVGNHVSHRDSCNPPHETKWDHDGLGRVVWTENAKGQRLTTTYDDTPGNDGSSRVYKLEDFDDARKVRTRYTHDALGRETLRVVTLEGQGGDQARYQWKTDYDNGSVGPNDFTVTVTDAEGGQALPKVTVTERDGLGRVVAVTVAPDVLDLRSEYVYDDVGNKATESDPAGHPTTFYADGLGRVHGIRDAHNELARVSYLDETLVADQTDRNQVVTSFEYDAVGRPTHTRVLAPGATNPITTSEVSYDDVGGRRLEKNGRGKTTTFVLDERGRVREELPAILPDDTQRRRVFEYDGEVLRSVTDRRNKKTTLYYDQLHRLTETVEPQLTNLVDADNQRNAKIDYDDPTNRRIETDRRNTATVIQLDPLGRTRSVERGGELQERMKFDAEGNVLERVDGRQVRTVYGFDPAWRVRRVTVAPGTPAAMQTDYVLNKDGLPTSEKEANERELVSNTKYFDTHLVEYVEDGLQHRTSYKYDEEGNRTEILEPRTGDGAASPEAKTVFHYDALNQLLKVEQGTTSKQVAEYERDENGNVIGIYEWPEGSSQRVKRVGISYDDWDRETKRSQFVNSGTALESFTYYDAEDNPIRLVDASGNETETEYDALSRPLWTRLKPGTGSERPWREVCKVDYTLRDGNGNPRTISEFESGAGGGCPEAPTREITFTYDGLDRLKSESAPLAGSSIAKTIGFDYEPNGLRKLVIHPDSTQTEYKYDEANRLKSIQNAEWATAARLSYHPTDGRLQRIEYPNGVTKTVGFDLANRVNTIAFASGSQVVANYIYEYFDNGDRRLQRETNGGGEEWTTYAYDELRRLKKVDYPDGGAMAYVYDKSGNRKEEIQYLNGEEVSRRIGQFDGLNRLTSLSGGGSGSASFAWNANGSMASRTDSTGTTRFVYDTQAQLAEVRLGESIVGRYQYDSEGRRIKTIGSDGIRLYLFDNTSIGAEFSETGSLVARNVWSNDGLLSSKRPTLGGDSFYHEDALGSAVAVTGAAGAVFARNRLDAWGGFRVPEDENPTNPIAAANRFAFTGHVYDRETNLYYAKARYYDPNLGRFLTQDSFLGEMSAPPSLHRYTYAHNRPTFYTDPTGHCVGYVDWCDQAMAWAVDKTRNVNFAGSYANTSAGEALNLTLHAGIEFGGNAAALPGNVRRGLGALFTPGARTDGGFEGLARTNQIAAFRQARESDSLVEKAYLTAGALASQPAVVLEEGLLEPVIQVPTQARNVGTATYRAYDAASRGEYTEAAIQSFEAVKEGSAAFGTLGGLAAGGRSLVAAAQPAHGLTTLGRLDPPRLNPRIYTQEGLAKALRGTTGTADRFLEALEGGQARLHLLDDAGFKAAMTRESVVAPRGGSPTAFRSLDTPDVYMLKGQRASVAVHEGRHVLDLLESPGLSLRAQEMRGLFAEYQYERFIATKYPHLAPPRTFWTPRVPGGKFDIHDVPTALFEDYPHLRGVR